MSKPKAYFDLLDESFPGIKTNILRCEKVGYPWRSKPFLHEVPLFTPEDDHLLQRLFRTRVPLSQRAWIRDNGDIACFNALFATFPAYWSLYYCPAIDVLLSFIVEGKALHLFDVVADRIPSLDMILDHVPSAIDDVYIYFAPEKLANQGKALPYNYDNGHLMAYGPWPVAEPFMIAPLSRC